MSEDIRYSWIHNKLSTQLHESMTVIIIKPYTVRRTDYFGQYCIIIYQ